MIQITINKGLPNEIFYSIPLLAKELEENNGFEFGAITKTENNKQKLMLHSTLDFKYSFTKEETDMGNFFNLFTILKNNEVHTITLNFPQQSNTLDAIEFTDIKEIILQQRLSEYQGYVRLISDLIFERDI